MCDFCSFPFRKAFDLVRFSFVQFSAVGRSVVVVDCVVVVFFPAVRSGRKDVRVGDKVYYIFRKLVYSCSMGVCMC